MKDNEIIKALECCFSNNFGKCEDCPLKNKKDEVFSCIYIKQKLAIDFINRQNAEIEENEGKLAHQAETIHILDKALADRMVELEESHDAHIRTIVDKDFEIEQLRTEKIKLHTLIPQMLAEAKSEARKEFAERLKKKATYYRCRDGIKYAVSISDIDNLLKEMENK